MRVDGKFVIYVIEHLANRKWVRSSIDYFGSPKGFNASGDCWQQTGCIGTFSDIEARDGLNWIRRKHTDRQFRVAKVITEQRTVPMIW